MDNKLTNTPQSSATTPKSGTRVPHALFGNLYVKGRARNSYFDYHPSVLKSGMQKYARRNEIKKGLWCLVEMDLFSLFEWNGPVLNAFLQKYPDDPNLPHANTLINSKVIRTNMVNRLVVMMSEEVNISAWWMPAIIFDLYQKWIENRGTPSSRKFLLDMYLYLTFQKMIRLISDFKSVFLLPPHYLKPDKMQDLLQIHKSIQDRYPQIYLGQDKVGETTWDWDTSQYPTEIQQCIRGMIYNLEIGSDNVFYWIRNLCDPEQAYEKAVKDAYEKNLKAAMAGTKNKKIQPKPPNLANTGLVWEILHHYIDQNSKYEFVRPVIFALQDFHTAMGHKEKPIYLYHAVLLIVRRDQIHWTSKPPRIDTPIGTVNKIYADHLSGGKMEMDEYVEDIHTKTGKKSDEPLKRFALEGAYVKNENKVFLNRTYRKIYNLFKKELDSYHKLIRLAKEAGVPIRNLSSQTMTAIKDAVQAQKRTARYKKEVRIVDDLVFKGPYKDNDKSLLNGLRYNYAIQLLEEALQLDERLRASLQWGYLGRWGDDRYYLAAPNVGKRKDIPFEMVNKTLDKNVKVAIRREAVKQVAEIEKTKAFTEDIKMATSQHLYFRYLLDIGDSGSHNVLVREDRHRTERLIAGIDLEERRGIKDNQSRLDRLFKKGASKDQVILYEAALDQIRTLSNIHLDNGTLRKLAAVGIDLERLESNIATW